MPGSPNLVAWTALVLWVPFSLLLPSMIRPSLAIAVILLGASLLLPSRIALYDPPVLPALGAEVIASLSALAASLIYCRKRLRSGGVSKGPVFLVGTMMIGALATALSNGDTISYGSTVLDGLTPKDAAAMVMRDFLGLGVPFFLGASLYRSPRDIERLLWLIVIAALVYSIPIFFEARMSPTLNEQVYGYTQGLWGSTRRWGGWRPKVFTTHGLALALFMLTSVVAATCLARRRRRLFGVSMTPVAGYLGLVFLLCKSMAATAYGLMSLPLLLLTRPKLQIRLAGILTLLIFAYPVLRTAELVPTAQVLEIAALVNERSAESLRTRFEQEDQLLAKARERLWFGWGSWGRNRIYHEETGKNLSLTDGYWIIRLGSNGVVGFVAVFALLLLPIGRANVARFTIPRRDVIVLSSSCWLLLVQILDLVPNAFLNVFTVFFCGALSMTIRAAARPGAHRSSLRRARGRSGAALDAPNEGRVHTPASEAEAPTWFLMTRP